MTGQGNDGISTVPTNPSQPKAALISQPRAVKPSC
jgi:hypothetical protein